MPENNIEQHSQQQGSSFSQQSTMHNSDSDVNKLNITAQETEEWDVVVTDQRRPQFRSNENNRGRNFRA
jgi:hypothetical protein